jgi:hypothetical protein
MSLMRISARALALMGVVILGQTAHAQALLSEDFAYEDGALTAVSGGLWTAHSGGGAQAIQVAGNSAVVKVVSGSAEDLNRPIGATLAPGETLYYALKFTVSDERALPTDTFGTSYFAHFKDNGTFNFRGRLYTTNGTDSTKFRLALSSSSFTNPDTANDPDFDQNQIVDGNDFLAWQQGVGAEGATNAQGDANNDDLVDDTDLSKWKQFYGGPPGAIGQILNWGSDLDFDTEYTVVVSYTADDDDTNPLLTSDGQASLWVNPTVITDTKITDTLSNPNVVSDLTSGMSTIALRQGGNGPMHVAIDKLSVATDFATVLADVANSPMIVASVNSVPEPASMGMLVCGLIALAERRRR